METLIKSDNDLISVSLNIAALLIFMRRTAPVEPVEPIEPADSIEVWKSGWVARDEGLGIRSKR